MLYTIQTALLIDAINYLGKNGWKLVNAFSVSSGTGPMVYHYVLRRNFLNPKHSNLTPYNLLNKNNA